MKELLKKIVEDSFLEARWLKTLSILEYIGSRKISKTVGAGYPALEILNHVSDETRHAAAFANLSYSLAQGESQPLCAEEGIEYFQALDQRLSEWVADLIKAEDPYVNYLFVTCAIERRAMSLYPLYQSLTPHEDVRRELRQVIVEESDHRKIIEEKVHVILKKHGYSDFSECQAMEESLFTKFSETIQSSLSKNP